MVPDNVRFPWQNDKFFFAYYVTQIAMLFQTDLIIVLQRSSFESTRAGFEVGAITVQPARNIEASFNRQVCPCACDHLMKLEYAVFADNNRMQHRHFIAVDACRKIRATYCNQSRLLKEKRRSRKMHFNHRFISIIAGKYIRNLGRQLVHSTPGIYTEMLPAIPAHILD